MKLFKILAHPYTLILSFCFIMISGEATGGFYSLYLLTGLPYGVNHAWLGAAGIVGLMLSHNFAAGVIKQIGNLSGFILLLLSLALFFKNDVSHYNRSTFEHWFPLFTLAFTAFVALCFLVGTFWLKLEPSKLVVHPLTKA